VNGRDGDVGAMVGLIAGMDFSRYMIAMIVDGMPHKGDFRC